MQFKVVPDITRNRSPVRKGRKVTSDLSRKLLSGKTVFVATAEKKTWGNVYRLAKSHDRKARVRWEEDYFGEQGYTIWFYDKDSI